MSSGLLVFAGVMIALPMLAVLLGGVLIRRHEPSRADFRRLATTILGLYYAIATAGAGLYAVAEVACLAGAVILGGPALALVLLHEALASYRTPDHPFCPGCGYDLRTQIDGACPECGQPSSGHQTNAD